jgi:hypothetical protein
MFNVELTFDSTGKKIDSWILLTSHQRSYQNLIGAQKHKKDGMME